MKTKKNDFIELDFVASIKTGGVFDTTYKEDAKKAGLLNEKNKEQFKPLIICIGQGMVVKGFDKSLEGREVSKEHSIELNPQDAFGLRDPKAIKPAPLSAFKEMPQRGMFVNVNGLIAKVITVTGGRVLIDFNNPLAGKVIIYKFQINKIIQKSEEKIKILSKNTALEISNIKIENNNVQLEIKNKQGKDKELELFKKKVKEILDLNITKIL